MLSYSFTSEEHQEDEELKCPKCFYFFSSTTKPYILPCNHNICLNCVDSLIAEDNNKCPICNYNFNKSDRNSFKVNFGFLNLVIKILQTKIIYCTKCNKIFYWKEHYQLCEQKYFENCYNILEEIKMKYEEGLKILKIVKKEINILKKCKIEVNDLVKRIINEIHKKYKENTNNKIKNELLKTNITINFSKSKLEIIDFLKLCLTYPQYFNTQEIMQVIRNIQRKEIISRKKINKVNKSVFSPPSIHPFFLTDEEFYDNKKEIKNYEAIVNKGIKLKNNFSNYNTFNDKFNTINKQLSIIYYNKRNKKDIISEEEDDKEDEHLIINNGENDEGINESDRIKVKIYHDNNISQLKKLNNSKKLNRLNNKSGILMKNILFKNQKPFKTSKLKIIHEKKRSKFDINSLLESDLNLEEEQIKNKIIVGLKDVKVISLKPKISIKVNNSLEKRCKINSKLFKSKYIMPGKKLDFENMNDIINNNIINNNTKIIKNNKNNNIFSKTIQVENDTPSLSLLRSTDYTKREYRFQLNKPTTNKNKNKLNNSIGINYTSNTINIDQSIDESISRRKIGNSNAINNNAFKIIKNYNTIKDTTNKLKKFFELIHFLYNYINKNVEQNMFVLKNNIKNNYKSLLNEMSCGSNHIQKNYLLTYINNTYNILIYDPFNRKYTVKNYAQMLKKNRININKFNNSFSIVYDDNDLIFISGGENNYNLFIIVTWSTQKIFHIEYMQTKKVFHKTIYSSEKLYLIGGMTPDKKVSAECYTFNLKEKKWYLMPKLNNARKNASLCFYNKSILYVFRGEDDNNILDTIEYIDINKKNGWIIFKPVDYGYVWRPAKNSMAVTVDKDKIIICGGEDNDGFLLKDCFLFEPSTKSIYKGLDLVTPSCFNADGCFYQDEIFGIDYKNKTQNNYRILHSCNIKNNKWKFSYIK